MNKGRWAREFVFVVFPPPRGNSHASAPPFAIIFIRHGRVASQDQPAASGTVLFLNNTYRAELIDTTLLQFNKEMRMSWRIAGTVDFAPTVGDQSVRFGVTFLTQ